MGTSADQVESLSYGGWPSTTLVPDPRENLKINLCLKTHLKLSSLFILELILQLLKKKVL